MSGAAAGGREVAHRVFAAEFRDATYSYTESEEERAPNYVLSPTGARINRLFVCGVLTSVERVNEETVRARIVDPTGAFVVYASQYQPDARAALEEIDPPAFVAMTGKANTFQPDGSDRIYSSVRPERLAVVDAETRDRWTVDTAGITFERLGRTAAAREDPSATAGSVALALEQYDPSPAYLSDLYTTCVDVLRLVAGELETIDTAELDLSAAGDPDVPLARIAEAGAEIADHWGVTAAPETTPADDASEPRTEADEFEEPPEEVLSADERASVEEEFGTEFTTGDEVESDPAASPGAAPAGTAEAEMASEPPEPFETESEPEDPGTAEPDRSPEELIVALLEDIDEGDGVDRETLVEAATAETGLGREEAADALDAAMMAGRCYESAEDVFKPI